MSKKKRYKKKRDVAGGVLFTAKVLCTVLLLCVLGYFGYVLAFQGWQAVVDWFEGKWFTFFLLLALFIATAALWGIGAYRRLKGLGGGIDGGYEDSDEY